MSSQVPFHKYQQAINKNKQLQKQLKQAYLLIKSLKQQNSELKQKLAYYQNQQSTINEINQQNNQSSQELFTSSSNESLQLLNEDLEHLQLNEEDQYLQNKSIQIKKDRSNNKSNKKDKNLSIMIPLSTQQTHTHTYTHNQGNSQNNTNTNNNNQIQKTIEKTPPRVIFNYQSEGSHIPKVLVKQPKKQIRLLQQNNIKNNNTLTNMSNINLRNINFDNMTNNNINSNQNSAIKTEQSILMKNTNPIFQRVKNSKKIYDTFFVTGFSFENNQPKIQYFYPNQSKHFHAILSLIYTQNSLRLFEGTNNLNNINAGTKSPKVSNQTMKLGKLSIKDNFVMLLCKNQFGQKQYLFACQLDDLLQGNDKNQYIFNRLICFVTSCNFFSIYLKIIQQFINKINNINKNQYKICSPISQKGAKEQLKILLEEHLRILYQKNIQQNQYANFGLGNQINIFIDVPSSAESYRNLLQYRPWGILFSTIHISNQNQAQQIKQKQLFGFLLIYLLTQTKILIYSIIKSKVSEAILHALQMIKPLQYVNPIIMATLKDQYHQYFNAPMSIIMGLWGQQKQIKRKQKIQIFMNKKPSINYNSLYSILEENKNNTIDGVIFNLDTGSVFGGGLNMEKNKIAIQLNYLIQNKCKSTKEQYKLFQNLLKGKNIQNKQMKDLSQKIITQIKNTQLFSVYRDKINSVSLKM